MDEKRSKEILGRVIQMMVRCYQMIALAQQRDRDLYDVIYNVSKDLEDINPKYTKKLRDEAVNCKRILIDPTCLDMVKDIHFDNIQSTLLETYMEASIELFQKEFNLSEYDARQLWLEYDKDAVEYATAKCGLKGY